MENRIVGRKLHYPVLASWTLRGQMVNKDDGVLSYCRKEAPLYIASKKRSPSIFAHHFCNLGKLESHPRQKFVEQMSSSSFQ